MTASSVTVDRLRIEESETKKDLVVSLARVMAIAYLVIGAVYALLWYLHPSYPDLVNLVAMAVLVVISLAGLGMASAGRLGTAAYLLVGGLLVVVTAAGAVISYYQGSMPSPFAVAAAAILTSVNYAVALVLAGLLLDRRSVIGLAALIVVVFLVQSVLGSTTYGNGTSPVELDAMQSMLSAVLGLILLLSVLATEYSIRLRSALAQSQTRARELELARAQAERRARELEEAKAELERRMAELAVAKQEIEIKRDISLGVAMEIRSMATELAATSSQQASGAAEQAAAMGQIVSTMEELSRAAGQIASHGGQVSQLASRALMSAESGRESVEETIAGLDRIRSHVRTVAEKNLELGQKTQAIGEIIEVITEIADRTHLLALNAAIESAAAGEYGRRFSVVASQVKELANEAKSAAHQVRAAVAEIQRAASATVLAAEKSESDVEAGAGLGRGAGNAISQIVDSVEEVAAAAKEMLMVTQQQRSASEQVVSTVREIEQVTRQSAEGSRQLTQAVDQLISASDRLE